MTYSHNTTAFALSLTFDLASIRFKVRPFKLLRAPSPHDHLPRLPILRILSEQSRRFLLGAEQHNMLEHPHGKILRFLVGQILAEPVGVLTCLVHAHNAHVR